MATRQAGRLRVPDLRADDFELRPLSEADLPELLRSPPDDEMRRWLTIRPHRLTEAVLRSELIGPSQAGWRDGTMAHFAIYGTGSGSLLGTISVRFYRHGNAEVGYDLFPRGRGRGIATRAVRLVAAWAFGELGVQRVELRVHPDNHASQRVAERAGFRREGVERSSRRLYDERHDCVVFSLLPSDG